MLVTSFIENPKHFQALWTMWKSYPPGLWTTCRSDGCFVDGVEKLSTVFVDNQPLYPLLAIDVENTSTAFVEK